MASYEPLGYRISHGFCHWLIHIRLSRLIALLLLVLIIVPLVAHYYLSKVANEGASIEVHHTRSKLEALEDLGSIKAADLRLRIDELRRIKLSVSNELRDLESHRQKLQSEIALYNQKIEELKADVLRQQQELERLKLSVEQAKYAQQEAIEKNMPDLAAPVRILASADDNVKMPPVSIEDSQHCQLHLCFDYSRCSLTSGFPVYFYSPDENHLTHSSFNNFVIQSVSQALGSNPHITYDPHIACVFIVLIGELNAPVTDDKSYLSKQLHELPHWNGDGRNHLLLNLARTAYARDLFYGVNIGRAMIIQTVFTETKPRPHFDLVVPALLGNSHGPIWKDLPFYAPARRKFLISFQGEHNVQNFLKSFMEIQNTSPKPIQNQKKSKIQEIMNLDSLIIESLKKMQLGNTKDQFFFQFSCMGSKISGHPSEWDICENASNREALLRESTFSLVLLPSNTTLYATFNTQRRLFESLKCGAIPVILGDYVQLPFDEVVSWNKAVIILPKARITELHFLIRTISDNDIYAMRHQGRLLWEKFLSSTDSVVSTILAAVRTRLQIPPLPIQEAPSPNVFNATFKPLKMENIVPETEPEESVGPIEPPYPSPKFRRNFTIVITDNYENWNVLMDPFYLYPSLPFDPVLPSEAKFMGSAIGFRPIGHGNGGAGKEFSEALGGNVPREQFTVIMLTFEREAVLMNSLQRLYGLPHLNKVVVVWNSPKLPPEDLRWPDIGVPIHVVKSKKNSLNNRFLPYDVVETEAILSVDDDAHLRHDEIMFGFRVWREARDRIVGFPGRYHAWDPKHSGWLYNANYSCELSMVLTGAAFFHKYYAYLYSYAMPQAIRDKVDEYMNCEDIAMNFLVSHVTRKPPVKVTSRWTFRCPGCPVALSEDDTHFQERHKCINFFATVFGYMPLLNTQFRVDSVLFKTRLPHDKQKCFKFI